MAEGAGFLDLEGLPEADVAHPDAGAARARARHAIDQLWRHFFEGLQMEGMEDAEARLARYKEQNSRETEGYVVCWQGQGIRCDGGHKKDAFENAMIHADGIAQEIDEGMTVSVYSLGGSLTDRPYPVAVFIGRKEIAPPSVFDEEG